MAAHVTGNRTSQEEEKRTRYDDSGERPADRRARRLLRELPLLPSRIRQEQVEVVEEEHNQPDYHHIKRGEGEEVEKHFSGSTDARGLRNRQVESFSGQSPGDISLPPSGRQEQ